MLPFALCTDFHPEFTLDFTLSIDYDSLKVAIEGTPLGGIAMPRVYKMSWDGQQLRWVKMYRGKRYSVSCSVLDAPPTKDGGRELANAWWTRKRTEIDAADLSKPRVPLPLEDVAAASLGVPPDLFGNVRLMLEQALLREEGERRAGKPLGAALSGIGADRKGDVEIVIDDTPEDAETIRRREVMVLLEKLLFGESPKLPQHVAEQLPPARVHQLETGAKAIRGETVAPKEQTIRAHVDSWIAVHKQLVTIGELSAARLDVVRHHAQTFIDFIGPDAAASGIDALALQSYYEHALSKIAEGTWSRAYCHDLFGSVRRFVRWLAEQGTIPMPPNIAARFRFGSKVQEIETWTVDEVHHVLGKASDRMRLYLLLMLNVGATQQDISDLADCEVNWTEGRVTRKRSKTKGKKNVPTVNYPLWPETLRLLRKNRSGQERVLLANTGRPLVRKEMRKDGKLHASDTIAVSFFQLQRRMKFRKNLKQLRKTSASLLEGHTVQLPSGETVNPFAGCVSLFLGHAPASMKDRHYAKPPQRLFDSAVQWLGQQLGFGTADAPENRTD